MTGGAAIERDRILVNALRRIRITASGRRANVPCVKIGCIVNETLRAVGEEP